MARGHHLHDLFRKLSSPTQRLLERLWDQQNATREAILRKIDAQNEKPIPRDLRSCLKAGNRSFEQIRYAYERGEDFVFVLSDFPKRAALTIRLTVKARAMPSAGQGLRGGQWRVIWSGSSWRTRRGTIRPNAELKWCDLLGNTKKGSPGDGHGGASSPWLSTGKAQSESPTRKQVMRGPLSQ
jgi:hypothetical protein